MENQLLRVVGPCGFTLSPKGVLATFAFPVFSVSSPRGSSLGFMRTGGGGTRMFSGCPPEVLQCTRGQCIKHRRVFLYEGQFMGISFKRGGFGAGA